MIRVARFLIVIMMFALIPFSSPVFGGEADSKSSKCGKYQSTICTLEMWLAYKQKKKNKHIRQTIKDQSVKVLRHSIQYWRPKGGHPPTNIAVGSGISAEDARWLIDMALTYNDQITMLVVQQLNPPQYAAIATSAWDENSQIDITPEQLEQLRDPSLDTKQFHALYVKLTGEAGMVQKFY